MSLLIKGGIVITMNRNGRIIKDGSVAVDGQKIMAVGRTEDVQREYGDAEYTIDARGKAVLPGLINPHSHFLQILVRGLGTRLDWGQWLSEYIYPTHSAITEKDCYIASLLACAEMLKSGTTFGLDNNFIFTTPNNTDSIAKAVAETGIKCILAPGPLDSGIAPEELRLDRDSALRECRKAIEKWNGKEEGRIKVWLGPTTPGVNVTPELCYEMYEMARSYKTKIIIHLAESQKLLRVIKQKYRVMGHVNFAHKIGILDENVVAVHCVWVNDSEIALLKKTKTSIVHNPTSNAILGDGIAPVPKMLKVGQKEALGKE